MEKVAQQSVLTQIILAELRRETETGFAKAKGNQCFENMFADVQLNHFNGAQQNDLEI